MTKGTKIFRIIISVLLALTMLISAFFVYVFFLDYAKEEFGIYVAGVSITRENQDDVLGDGTVFYDDDNNVLVFGDATIESEKTIIYSKNDLNIELFGENKFVCTNETSATGIYAGNYNIGKDLAIGGEGSLTIEIPNAKEDAVGISASNLSVLADLTVITPDCEHMANGIVCATSLIVVNKATVTVHNGAAETYCSAVRVRGNAFFEEGTALKVSVNPGTTGNCKGFSVSGDLFLGKGTSLDVSIDDGATDFGECIRVSGLMTIEHGAAVTASSKNAYAIECFSTIEANKDAVISAASEKKDADIFCSGAVVNCGAAFEGEMDVIGGIHNRDTH